MDPRIAQLTQNIKAAEGELELELAQRLAKLRISLDGKRLEFEQEMLARHRKLKTSLMKYILGARPLVILTAPLIYSMIIPFLLIDLSVTLYQRICFPIYGIAPVRRRDYFVFDRARLPYLNAIESVNCAFCSYGNGVAAYVREVAARTELHWCPIKHARRVMGQHTYYNEFADFGDAEAYRSELESLRTRLAQIPGP